MKCDLFANYPKPGTLFRVTQNFARQESLKGDIVLLFKYVSTGTAPGCGLFLTPKHGIQMLNVDYFKNGWSGKPPALLEQIDL